MDETIHGSDSPGFSFFVGFLKILASIRYLYKRQQVQKGDLRGAFLTYSWCHTIILTYIWHHI